MERKLNRRQILTGTAAVGVGIALGARPIRRANAAGKRWMEFWARLVEDADAKFK